MKVGTIVKVNERHRSAGETGVILEQLGDKTNVYWKDSDLTYWIETRYLDVVYEEDRI